MHQSKVRCASNSHGVAQGTAALGGLMCFAHLNFNPDDSVRSILLQVNAHCPVNTVCLLPCKLCVALHF